MERINYLLAKIGAFLVFALAFLVFYDTLMRYLFHQGSIALQELEWYLFDLTFLLPVGYTLASDKHVRVELFYEKFPPKVKELIDVLDNLLLIIPFSLLLLYFSFDFVTQSFLQQEGSSDPGGLPYRWIIKSAIVIFSLSLLLQALLELKKTLPKIELKSLVTILLLVGGVLSLSFTTFTFFIHPAILMFLTALLLLMLGFRVAFVFAFSGLLFVLLDWDLDLELFKMLPMRIYGIMQNFTLMAVPLFILMGLILERSELAKKLLENIGALFGDIRGGLAVAVIVVGAILAAATGIVGASVVMMSVITLPIMLKYGYNKPLSAGVIAASGTLGQIIPPSIVLIVLGDVLSVSVGDLFKASVVPGLLLVVVYILYVLIYSLIDPRVAPPVRLEKKPSLKELLASILPPFLLIVAVLGTIFAGVTTPTESAAMGVVGALVLSGKKLSLKNLLEVGLEAVKLTSMIFTILIGATAFSLVFNEIGGEELVHNFFSYGDRESFIFIAMVTIFLLGFFIDFVEICFVVIPLFVPLLATFKIEPIWFGVLVALNLQASFLTPPFGFSLFYLKGSAGRLLSTQDIYKGVIPFILLQILVLGIIYLFPQLVKV